MKLSYTYMQENQNYNTDHTQGETTSSVEQGIKNGTEEMLNKTPGQTISGEVLQINGNDILIAIGKNQLINARLDSSVKLDLGQLLTFQIKNLNLSKVILSPLFENTAKDQNALKALQAAGLPFTDSMNEMVRVLMQEGMSIDKNTLQHMCRLMNAFPKTDITTLVQMNRMQLPVTENSIFQFQAYKNYEHMLHESLMEITDAIPETFKGLMQDGKLNDAIFLYKEVISFLSEEGGMPADDALTRPLKVFSDAFFQETKSGETGILPEGSSRDSIGSAAEQNLTGELLKNISNNQEPEIAQKNQSSDSAETAILHGKLALSNEDLKTLADSMQKAGFPQEFTEALANGTISSQEFFKKFNDFLNSGLPSSLEEQSKLFGKNEFIRLLNRELQKNWLLLPQEVAEDKQVQKLYERLNSQMNRLTQVLEQAARADTPLGRAVVNVSGNIDFMNQLNQMFTYIQLPLKINGKNANGELYVYTNKKNLAKKDGKVSALLHLDMEHLGSLDVHVSLMEKNVSTQFYLADESALDLMAEHIDMLDERLKIRGYTMKSEFIKREQPENVMEEMLKQGKNIGGGGKMSILSKHSFDAKA